MFIHTGDYVEHRNDAPLNSTYYTFTPRPLMDGGYYSMTDEFASLLATAHRNIGVLEGMLFSFHERETLAKLMMLKESCFSKMIDYPDFDSYSFFLNHGLGKTDDDINNIVSAYRNILEAHTHATSCDDIFRCVLHGSNSKQKVGIRSSQIFLTKSISNYRQYNPTAPKDIHSAMIDINRYLELDGIDVLIKTAMCHYQFEMIHPYERCNGIVGRLLMYKMLYSAGLKEMLYISLSECLYNRKIEYFEKLGQPKKTAVIPRGLSFLSV